MQIVTYIFIYDDLAARCILLFNPIHVVAQKSPIVSSIRQHLSGYVEIVAFVLFDFVGGFWVSDFNMVRSCRASCFGQSSFRTHIAYSIDEHVQVDFACQPKCLATVVQKANVSEQLQAIQ